VYHGPNGLIRIGGKIHKLTKVLDKSLKDLGYKQTNKNYFDTLHIDLGDDTTQKLTHIIENATKNEMNFRYFKDGSIGISLNESTDFSNIVDIISVFASAVNKTIDENTIKEQGEKVIVDYPTEFTRTTEYLQHDVFNSYHSETEMMRYIKSLENKDLSLMHSMISLGSCTMKLNATTEMLGITWPQFSKIHPFAPIEQVKGYKQLIKELEKDLAEITGFKAVSLQPNSGAQGEYTGLMVIREYHISRGEGHRNIVVIPASAHGTNPASAAMAGMKVVVINSTSEGNIDIEDLKKKVEQNKNNIAALMITYPSTHGVFEEDVKEICSIIHKNGGQVYMDGANMNAQVGLTNPAIIGADVCHLNLHKTFCIPHGGGGPGVGPIAVAKHLAPFLPNHSVVDLGHKKGIHSVSSAPWGSANILIISYAYIKMMGSEGLTEATKTAILNANYLKAKLGSTFNVLYSGKNGRVAHELIFDMRKFKETAHVEVEDIAKRLMDYGYHAPTVSFPVAGTLMIEPTESESKKELDRFCEALLSIREEIREIESGIADPVDNVLKNSPHTAEMVISDEWKHTYSREKAAYPTSWTRVRKFWPTTGRVNNAYGDRNLICTCTPVSSYSDEVV
jgi:glycine dehydrogenase